MLSVVFAILIMARRAGNPDPSVHVLRQRFHRVDEPVSQAVTATELVPLQSQAER